MLTRGTLGLLVIALAGVIYNGTELFWETSSILQFALAIAIPLIFIKLLPILDQKKYKDEKYFILFSKKISPFLIIFINFIIVAIILHYFSLDNTMYNLLFYPFAFLLYWITTRIIKIEYKESNSMKQ